MTAVLERERVPGLSAGIYAFVTDGDRDFMVMEPVQGETLEVLAGGPLPPMEVMSLGRQLAEGLAAAHAANVIHRDIKPSNITVTPGGCLKILDVGLTRLTRDDDCLDVTASSACLAGTVLYMAPEQVRGESAGERSDVFGVGAFDRVIHRASQKYAERRFATAQDLADALADIEAAAGSSSLASWLPWRRSNRRRGAARTAAREPGPRLTTPVVASDITVSNADPFARVLWR